MGSFGRASIAGLYVHLLPKDNLKTIPQVPSTLSGSNISSVLRSFKTFVCRSAGRFRIFFRLQTKHKINHTIIHQTWLLAALKHEEENKISGYRV